MKITIAPYDPAWPEMFQEEEQRIAALLGELSPRIEHIGSTSVPGLAAKPVIDIAVGMQSMEDLDRVPERMLQDPHYRYLRVYEDSMPLRRFFLRIASPEQLAQIPQIVDEERWTVHPAILTRQYHIHIWPEDTEEFQRHIRFRDYIRSHPEARQAYEDLKRELAEKEWKHGNDYAGAKTRFIRAIEARTKADNP
jgi:GrpB-like predicted nucleotidyltransferase (UPF0157 family)